jgi:hypothetical protein
MTHNNDVPDYTMFLKLLNLTTSPFDHEALSAIRMANAVLARNNHTWEDLLQGKVVMIEPPEEPKPRTTRGDGFGTRHYDGAEINAYFDTLLNSPSTGSFRDWVESVHDWWEKKGFLTEAQYNSLKRSATRRR